MGFVLDYIVKTSDNKVTTYDTLKRFINEGEEDIISDFEDHLTGYTAFSAKKYAESHPVTGGKYPYHPISDSQIRSKHDKSPIKLFLDGSRHVYKTGDMVIGGVVYPIVVGQIIISCCERNQRQMHSFGYDRQIVLAVPDVYDIGNHKQNFFNKKRNELNEAIKKKYANQAGFVLQFNAIIPYDTSSSKELGRNKYIHKAISVVQNQMTDLERQKVSDLCANNILSPDSWLIKDGSLEYRKDLTNRKGDSSLDEAMYNVNMSYVLGVSKMFDPELLSEVEPKIGRIIAELPPLTRTNAYRYIHENHEYCVWYLRLRDTPNRSSQYADVIKVEFLCNTTEVPSTSKVDNICSHLINEASPVCFGKDNRWANHIYPIYVTETYAKSKYIDDNIIMNQI